VKLALVLALAIHVNAQAPVGQRASKPDVAVEVHLKAVKLVELSGERERIQSSLPEMMEQAKSGMRKQCPNCDPAFFTEWAKRFTARLRIDDYLAVIVRAYEKRFTDDELTEFLAVLNSQTTEKPVPLSPTLKKKLSDLLPAILGDVSGGSTEIGAKLGGEIGTEIQKEHPEYFPAK
jgi:hypothetical protein